MAGAYRRDLRVAALPALRRRDREGRGLLEHALLDVRRHVPLGACREHFGGRRGGARASLLKEGASGSAMMTRVGSTNNADSLRDEQTLTFH